ncbi:polysaccharide pyruvyl transferase family protein [Pontibacillus salipaludis]|uniref:Polysaccharide pyruvyl transferase CsaB n=1 Tax=Pontibacillus salipaludis TaxID=1697394 RepID=A0ABQ1QL33_9BACI|nr:polysaccharide pyruvyl transferase family protein [Pontibacillus salipaludis]GGD28609.1 polysaccharide pyruvyl transferase CsaB [Pontibacillus salipaludis]
MKKVLLRGYYGFNNFGDDALLHTLIYRIFNDNNRYQITVLSKGEVFDDPKIKFSSTKKLNILKEVIQNNVLVFGGGSQFQDFGTKNNKKELIFKLLLIILAKVSGSKVIQLGISVGPLKTRIGKTLAKASLLLSDKTFVRDDKSFRFLEENLPAKKKYFLIPDLTLLLHDLKNNDAQAEINIGINVLPYHKTTKANIESQDKLFSNLRKALINIKDNNPNIRFTFFAFQNDSNVSDKTEIEKISDGDSQVISYFNSVEDFNESINKCTHFISMRFHAAVFAYMNRIPQINLGYHQKCLEFMEYYGYTDGAFYDIRSKEISSNKLQNRIESLIETPNNFLPTVDPLKNKKEFSSLIDEIQKTLEKGREK